MSLPREVHAGATSLVTRRCLERRFLLRPSKLTNAIFLFVLAVAAWRFGIRVHAFCVMSNHFHLVLTDPKGRLPAFMQLLCGVVARAMNLVLGRQDHFFEAGSYNAVELPTAEDILRKVVYVLANPVAEALVRRGNLWPGLWSHPEWVGGKALPAPQPKGFFSGEGVLPKLAKLALRVPPGFASAEEFRRRLWPALREREDELARGGVSFLGVARVLRTRPTDRPRTKEDGGHQVPRHAAADDAVREVLEERFAAFKKAYAEALVRWREGRRSVVFPAGTYLMRVLHGAACAPAG